MRRCREASDSVVRRVRRCSRMTGRALEGGERGKSTAEEFLVPEPGGEVGAEEVEAEPWAGELGAETEDIDAALLGGLADLHSPRCPH